MACSMLASSMSSQMLHGTGIAHEFFDDSLSIRYQVLTDTGRTLTVIPTSEGDQDPLRRISKRIIGHRVLFGGYLRASDEGPDLVLAQHFGIYPALPGGKS